MKLRKIKDIKKGFKKGTQEKTERQLEAARLRGTRDMLLNNPMKRPEVRKKISRIKKGKITSPKSLFKKGNTAWKKRTKESNERAGRLMGMKNLGRKKPENLDKIHREFFKNNNPMKNPEVIKKIKEANKIKREMRKIEKLKKAYEKNENFKKHNFLPNILITDELKCKMVKMYKDGKSLQKIANEVGLDRGTVRRKLVAERVKIRSNNRMEKEVLK